MAMVDMTRPSASNGMDLDPAEVLEELVAAPALRLATLPREHGLYALRDHEGSIRYIGITRGDRLGFYGRINNRHVSGSESRSHKYSHAYNTGRMWRAVNDCCPDALLAKALRVRFIRRYCTASLVIVPQVLRPGLSQLEIQVQQLAPDSMFAWGGKRTFLASEEPVALVDALIQDEKCSVDHIAAFRRQADRFLAQRSADAA